MRPRDRRPLGPLLLIGRMPALIALGLPIAHAIGKVPLDEVAKNLWLFWIATVLVLLLVTYIPPLAMTTPTPVGF